MSKESDSYKAALSAVTELENQLGSAVQALAIAEAALHDNTKTSAQLDAAAVAWKNAKAAIQAAQDAMAAAQKTRQDTREALLASKG